MSHLSDDQLRASLGQADPARYAPPLDESRVRMIVAAVERDEMLTNDGRRSRRRWSTSKLHGVTIGSAATALTAAAAIVVGVAGVPTLQTAPPDPDPGIVGSAPTCGSPTVDELRTADTAFEAVVSEIQGPLVSLTITAQYAGGVPETVTLEQQSFGGTELFVQGQTYLVALDDGHVLDCGTTDVATGELRELYREAFE